MKRPQKHDVVVLIDNRIALVQNVSKSKNKRRLLEVVFVNDYPDTGLVSEDRIKVNLGNSTLARLNFYLIASLHQRLNCFRDI